MTGNTRLAAAFFWLIVSCLCWAANYIIARLMMTQTHLTPSSVTFWRYLAAALIMFCAGMTTLGWRRFFAIRRSGLASDAGAGAVMSLVSLMLLWCERFNSAMDAAMVDAVIPVMIMLGSVFIGQKIRMLQLIGMMISLSGCLFVIRVVTPDGLRLSQLHWSDLLIGPAGSWALYVLWGRGRGVCRVLSIRAGPCCRALRLSGFILCWTGRCFPCRGTPRMVAPCLDDFFPSAHSGRGIRHPACWLCRYRTFHKHPFRFQRLSWRTSMLSEPLSAFQILGISDYLRCGNGPRNFRPAEKTVRALSASCAFRQEVNPCRNIG
ncbi:MAG: DMT family transporter [Victivallales bacterium]